MNNNQEINELEKIISDSYSQETFNDKDPSFFIQKAGWHIANARNVKDYAKAFGYAKKSIKYGYVEGYYILGQLYYYGTGCEQNLIRALSYFSKFVEEIDLKVYNNNDALSDSYYKLCEGNYKIKNYSKAIYYYHKLQSIDPLLAESLGDFEKEISGIAKEKDLRILKVALSFVLVCCGILFLSTTYKDQILGFINGMKIINYDRSLYANNSQVITTTETRQDKDSSIEFYFSDNTMPGMAEVKDYKLLEAKLFSDLNLKDVYATNAWASSEYISSKGTDYSILCAIDGDESTSYQEGVSGGGIGETIHFDFSKEVKLQGIVILNGKTITKDDYYNNNRVASFIIKTDKEISVALEDKLGKQYIYFNEPIETSSIDIVIDSVFSGLIYDDTCITDIWFFE